MRDDVAASVYWRLWLWWHARFEWCLCACDFCGHRFLHAATCAGTSRIRRRG